MASMTMDEAVAFLVGDEDLGTPGSLYGSHASDCAPVAYVLALVLVEHSDSEMGEELLDHCMGLVVNSHDDVESLLTEHAGSVGWRFTEDYSVEPIDAVHTHTWGPVQRARFSGEPHRACTDPDCRDITLDLYLYCTECMEPVADAVNGVYHHVDRELDMNHKPRPDTDEAPDDEDDNE